MTHHDHELPTHVQVVNRHLGKADEALSKAEKAAASGLPVAASWAAIAQAHYTAANVKDLLGTDDPISKYAVPEPFKPVATPLAAMTVEEAQRDSFDRPDGLR